MPSPDTPLQLDDDDGDGSDVSCRLLSFDSMSHTVGILLLTLSYLFLINSRRYMILFPPQMRRPGPVVINKFIHGFIRA